MIEEGSGNLLTQDVEALVNTVNTVGVMGKGIALQFKRAFPANYAAYRAAADREEIRLGEVFLFDSGLLGPRRYIVNFPTKGHWRSPSRLIDVRTGLADLARRVRELGITSIAIPALGCGNGGLDWAEVRPLIEATFSGLPHIRVVLFGPGGAPAADDMPVATGKPRLTLNRSVLLLTLHRYLERARSLDHRDGVSELETQKLAYFLQVLGQPSRLAFGRGRYGPYAEQLHHVLQQLEGHYIVGYGDRTALVTDLQPINLTPGAVSEASAWLDQHDPRATDLISRLMSLVDGFEMPYSLELLATAHFAAHQDPGTDAAEVVSERVQSWNLRKARLFTDAHVTIAVDRLREHDLLPRAPTQALSGPASSTDYGS